MRAVADAHSLSPIDSMTAIRLRNSRAISYRYVASILDEIFSDFLSSATLDAIWYQCATVSSEIFDDSDILFLKDSSDGSDGVEIDEEFTYVARILYENVRV